MNQITHKVSQMSNSAQMWPGSVHYPNYGSMRYRCGHCRD